MFGLVLKKDTQQIIEKIIMHKKRYGIINVQLIKYTVLKIIYRPI